MNEMSRKSSWKVTGISKWTQWEKILFSKFHIVRHKSYMEFSARIFILDLSTTK